jgi:hypothetical protein
MLAILRFMEGNSMGNVVELKEGISTEQRWHTRGQLKLLPKRCSPRFAFLPSPSYDFVLSGKEEFRGANPFFAVVRLEKVIDVTLWDKDGLHEHVYRLDKVQGWTFYYSYIGRARAIQKAPWLRKGGDK